MAAANDSIRRRAASIVLARLGEEMMGVELRSELESQDNMNSTSIIDNAESSLDSSIQAANAAKGLLNSGSTYEAAKSLDEATTTFTSVIESKEVSALLGLEEDSKP